MPHYDPQLDVVIADSKRCRICQSHIAEPGQIVCDECKTTMVPELKARPGMPRLDPVTRQLVQTDAVQDPKVLARQELARRELARRHLIPFAQRFMPTYVPDWAHWDIAARLERFMKRVERQESPRLILNCPPRLGKSLLSSQFFPAFALGHHPEWEFIATSHTLSLQLAFSRRVRAMLNDPRYTALFPETLIDPENKAATGWKTTMGGGFLPAGVGGNITGFGAHIGIIDDFIKNFEESQSLTTREAIWNWYTSTFYTRLAPGGGVLVIATRWHLDDLVGRLEEEMRDPAKDQWEIVRYSALAEKDEYRMPSGKLVSIPLPGAKLLRKAGESCSPTRWPKERYEKIRQTVTPGDWAALYMQTPSAGEGVGFTKDMFRFYDELPKRLVKYSTWDLAIGKKETNDYTVGLTGGVDEQDDLYIIDRVRARMDSYEIVEAILDQYQLHKPEMIGIEKGHISLAIGPYLSRRIAERRLYSCHVEEMPTGNRDKISRARSIQGRLRQGKIWLPRNAPWVQEFIAELLQFPNGRHDDQVDAFAWLGILLEEMRTPGAAPRPQDVPKWMQKLQSRHRARSRKHWLSA